MALPKQVQDQLKELEKIEQQLAQGNEPKTPASTEEPKDPNSEPAEPPKDPEPTPTDPAPVEKKPEAPTEPVVAEETWQQKYRTLKGMYDAEVPRLHAELRELKATVESLRKAPEPAPASKPAEPTKLVTDADVEAFGSDLIEVQRKVAREVAQEFRAELETLKAENADLRKQIGETGTKVVEASFEQSLHRLVPDFDAVNTDQRWIDWLNELDPMLRAPRKVMAQEAFSRGDAEAVAYYIGMFKQTLAPAAEPTPAKNVELERQVQPNRSSSPTAPVSSKGKTYTSSQIQNMFQKAAILGGQGKHEEARQLEAEIDAAYMEGRVTA